MPKDYYAVLNISPKADQEVIDRAFRRLALKYHPALNPSVSAYEQIREIIEAWKVLSDPAGRVRYDRSICRTQEIKSAAPNKNQSMPTGHPQPAFWQREESIKRSSAIPPDNLKLNSRSIWRVGIGMIVLLIAFLTLWGGQGRLVWFEAIILSASLLTYSFFGSEGTSRLEWLGLTALSVAGVVILVLAFPEFTVVQSFAQGMLSGAPNILSAAPNPVPVATATQSLTCRGGCRVASFGCFIKARINPVGRRVYYLPGDRGYDEIAIDPTSSSRWFCSEPEATANGWVRYREEPTSGATPDVPASVTPVDRRALYVCVPVANVRSGPGLEFAVVMTSNKRESWNVVGKVKQWYYVGKGEDGQTLYIYETMLCAD